MPRGMHGRHAGTEKAKDFKGTIRKLIRYMSAFKIHMLFVAVFAVCGTIFNGLVSKVSGGSGIDFGRVGQILLLTLGVSHKRPVHLHPGDHHDRGVPEDDLPAAQRDLREDQPHADELF